MSSKKLKVALLSFHNAYNYGAALQVYALQEALNQMGVKAEYIDYINEHRKYSYDTQYLAASALKSKNIVRAAKVVVGSGFISLRGKKFKEFYDKKIKRTAKVYQTSSEARALNRAYDKFIVGSDQVWNCRNNGGDAAYLLDFVDDPDDKISYASSFGLTDLPESFVSMYSENLSKIGRLSVREGIGASIVKKYTGKKPHVVLDPVFLVGAQTWEKLKQEGTAKRENFIFFYTNRGSQMRDFLDLGYQKKDMRSHILSSTVGIKDFADRNTTVRVTMAPADFLNEIANAKLVVTASFHCVAFAIIFQKQFVVYLTGERGKDERILNLLHICGLESRIITSSTRVKDVDAPIDYDAVNSRLQPYLEYSREYLRRAVFSLPDVEDLEFPDGESKYFCDDGRCTGCMACKEVCPACAIVIRKNEEGFWVPFRNESKCIDCYKCHNACQVYRPLKKTYDTDQRYYAIKNKDEIRRKSSSGGIFTAFSDEILNRGGVVCAAAMSEDFKVKHVFASTKSERDLMRKTIYVQSEISDVYGKIKKYLYEKTPVLFVGTPCQVAGLYRGLEDSDLSFLYTCDIVCHGVPSPGIFDSFMEYLRNWRGQPDAFNFRDKELGWKHGYTVSAVFEGKKLINTLEIQSFSKMFSRNIINRQSCANCMYTNYNRMGDVTIGDYWGIEKLFPDYADYLGVSLLMVNTKNGEDLFSKCSDITKLEVDKSQTVQNSLLKQAEPSINRMNAFRTFNESGYEALSGKYGECNKTGIVKNCIREIAGK